jgi:hypothetical protein
MMASKASAKMEGRLCPPGARLAIAQPNDFRQIQANGELVQRFLFDQIGAHTGQITFRQGT